MSGLHIELVHGERVEIRAPGLLPLVVRVDLKRARSRNRVWLTFEGPQGYAIKREDHIVRDSQPARRRA